MNYSNVILIHRRIGRSLLQAAAPAPEVAGIPQTPIPAVSSPAHHNKEVDSTKMLIILLLVIALCSLGFLCLNISGFINHILSPDTPPSSSNSDHRAPPRNSKGGLASSAVDSLPVLAYGKHTMIDDCPICLIEFEERESVKLIPYCGHVFHPTCIDTWLDSHVTCPVCRSAELFKRDDEVCLDMTQDKDGETASTVENWTRGG